MWVQEGGCSHPSPPRASANGWRFLAPDARRRPRAQESEIIHRWRLLCLHCPLPWSSPCCGLDAVYSEGRHVSCHVSFGVALPVVVPGRLHIFAVWSVDSEFQNYTSDWHTWFSSSEVWSVVKVSVPWLSEWVKTKGVMLFFVSFKIL